MAFENVPILVARDYSIGGEPEDPEQYVDYCLKTCTWTDRKYEAVSPQKLGEIVERFIAANPKLREDDADWLRRQAE